MTRFKRIILLLILILFFSKAGAGPLVRIKDISRFDGVRDNQLIGYGLVVGLAGTGDSAKNSFTVSSIVNMLTTLGIPVDKNVLTTKNIAAVLVTATLPPFAKEGSKIDVIVSAIGDASSLRNGTLLQTPLRAANREIYAVAQGQISLGGTTGMGRGGGGTTHPTVARIPEGAIIEMGLQNDIVKEDGNLKLLLLRPDFTTSSRIASAINQNFKNNVAKAVDANQIVISIPDKYKQDVITYASMIEELLVEPDNYARVVINERTGTVVMGNDVRIDAVAITHGDLTVTVRREEEMELLPQTQTAQTERRATRREAEKKDSVVVLQSGASISDLVRALNTIGAKPRDIIAILQAIKEAGALKAELVFI
ncbi:MAG: flagellar basal body P-ring protein FlgI [Candidatus Hydrogenedentota bacterium]